jgi:tetratricopeptide (TPR) repeat protein
MRYALSLVYLLLTAGPAGPELTDEARQKEAVKHYRAGQTALQTEHLEDAEKEFLAATRLDPRLAAAHYGLGQVFMATKRYPESIRAYLACREAFEKDAASTALEGVAAQKRLDDQIRAMRDNINALQSGRVTTANTSASILRLQDQVRDYESRRNRSGTGGVPPAPPGVSLALGSAYFRNQQLPEAEEAFKAAIAADSRIGETHNNLAVVFMLTGRLDEAQKEVELAEKAGFSVSSGLKQDIEKRRAAAAARP